MQINGYDIEPWADLSGADLSGADLSGANLSSADLSGADLSGADLTRADLSGADLSGANLTRADLSGANLDYASWPLWCGSDNVIIDERIARQLMAHMFSVCKKFCKPTKKQIQFCNQFHRIISGEFPKITGETK